jgi:hypothetical protein
MTKMKPSTPAPMIEAHGLNSRTRINTNELAQSIAGQLDGWSQLVDNVIRLENWLPADVTPPSEGELASEILAGADPNDVGKRILLDQEISRLIDATWNIVQVARRQLNEQIIGWLDAHAREASDLIATELTSVLARARELLPDLADVDQPADLSKRPMAGSAWGELETLASRFSALRLAHRDFVGLIPPSGTWPLSDLIGNYAEVWPDFDRIRNIESLATSSADSTRINAVPPPWESQDADGAPRSPAQVLKWLAGQKVTIALPVNETELAATTSQLRIAAAERSRKRVAASRQAQARMVLNAS